MGFAVVLLLICACYVGMVFTFVVCLIDIYVCWLVFMVDGVDDSC